MRRPLPFVLALTLAAGAALPHATSAQLSIAPKIGTLGVGGDIGLALGSMATLRGGFGFVPVEPSGTFSGTDFDVSIPDALTLGLDFHPGGGGFRVSGGVMFQSDDLTVDGQVEGSVEIGGTTYSDVTVLNGVVENNSAAPFLMLGFGKHGQSGVGFFIDAGVAFLGDPELTLTAEGGATGLPGFQADLAAEEADIQDDLDTYGKYYPILNVGIRIGLGR